MNHDVEKMPVVIGKNRLRGNSVGAMIDDDFCEDNLQRLRSILKIEAAGVGLEVSAKWLTDAVSSLLDVYHVHHGEWLAAKDGTIGHLFEAVLPSGRSLLIGDRRILDRLPSDVGKWVRKAFGTDFETESEYDKGVWTSRYLEKLSG